MLSRLLVRESATALRMHPKTTRLGKVSQVYALKVEAEHAFASLQAFAQLESHQVQTLAAR